VEVSPSNDVMVSRTVGGISLGPTGNIQGTYIFMSLLTGKLVKARSFTPLPMPDDVVKKVDSMVSSVQVYNAEDDDPIMISNRSKSYLPTHEDDESMNTNDYSGISAQELIDILEDSPEIQEETSDLAQMQLPSDAAESIQGVEIEGVGEDIVEENVGQDEEIEQEDFIIDESWDQENSSPHENDSPEENQDEEAGFEDLEIPNSDDRQSRTHYTTRSGRSVRLSKDLVDNYELLQSEEIEETGSSSRAHSSTQWSLKQGMKYFPKETKEATMTELMQLHNMRVFHSHH
jgi:hypothetical protein